MSNNQISEIAPISTRDLSTRKKVPIADASVNGGKPHVYIVKKLGAGEEMDLSQTFRQLLKLMDKAQTSKWTDKDSALFDELKKTQLEIYYKTFDDCGDGTLSRALVGALTDEERNEIYNQVFPKSNLSKLLEQSLEEDELGENLEDANAQS